MGVATRQLRRGTGEKEDEAVSENGARGEYLSKGRIQQGTDLVVGASNSGSGSIQETGMSPPRGILTTRAVFPSPIGSWKIYIRALCFFDVL